MNAAAVHRLLEASAQRHGQGGDVSPAYLLGVAEIKLSVALTALERIASGPDEAGRLAGAALELLR